jgi:WD40 repeat protein
MENPSLPVIYQLYKAIGDDCYTQITWGDLNYLLYLSTTSGLMMTLNATKLITSPMYDGKVIPSLDEFKLIRKFIHKKQIFSFTLANDYSLLFTCGNDCSVVLSDPETLAPIKKYGFNNIPARAVGIYPLYKQNPFSDSIKYHIAVGGGIDAKDVALQKSETGYYIRILNFVTGDTPLECPGHFGPIHSIAYSPDGKSFATASEDSTIRLWVQTDEYDDID